MMGRPPRRFTLADIMILVAASGVALLLWRIYREYHEPTSSPLGLRVYWPWAHEASPFVFSTALALLIMRLIPPRPPARRLFRQPGTLACLVVIVVVLMRAAMLAGQSIVLATLHPRSGISFPAAENFAGAVASAGYSVGLVWGSVALARAWRPEPSWIDRSGRLLGWLLVAAYGPFALGL